MGISNKVKLHNCWHAQLTFEYYFSSKLLDYLGRYIKSIFKQNLVIHTRHLFFFVTHNLIFVTFSKKCGSSYKPNMFKINLSIDLITVHLGTNVFPKCNDRGHWKPNKRKTDFRTIISV